MWRRLLFFLASALAAFDWLGRFFLAEDILKGRLAKFVKTVTDFMPLSLTPYLLIGGLLLLLWDIRDRRRVAPAQTMPSDDAARLLNRPIGARIIRDGITTLVDELMLVRGRTEMNSTQQFLQLGEDWHSESQRITLFQLLHEKVCFVPHLKEILNALRSLEGGPMIVQYGEFRRAEYGYERVYQEYLSILGRKWILARAKSKVVLRPDPFHDCAMCAYGLIEFDRAHLDRLLSALEQAEAAFAAPA